MNNATQNVLPLLGLAEAQAPLLLHEGRNITRGEFIASVLAVAAQLPHKPYAINLCQNRYHFMLGLAAACLREQTNLLPANQASGALQAITSLYPEHYVMDDALLTAQLSRVSAAQIESRINTQNIRSDHVAAICFTSGSTGQPQAHANTWGTLVASAQRSAAGIFLQPNLNLVATVPPQHMFGLETSIFQPLVNRCAIHSGKPFFPADVHSALQSVAAPRALITTPTHLRACVTALASVPSLEFVLSATAPLSIELAAQTESAWHTQVLEIYGTTETGAIATRRTTQGETWLLLPGGSLAVNDGVTEYQAAHATQPITLHDSLQLLDDTHFVLAGRNSDLIKIAGKRASLAELNSRLLAIPGVIDGVIFQPLADQRVAALAVVDNIHERDILLALAQYLDEVFLPRPLRIVAALPRDAVGKLPRAALLSALEK